MSTAAGRQSTGKYGTLLLAVSIEPEEVGRRIKGARDRKGWTQLEFALEAGVSPSSVQRWEGGELPPIRRLMRLAELLDVEVQDFVEQDQVDPSELSRLRGEVRDVRQIVERILRLVDPDERNGEEPPQAATG